MFNNTKTENKVIATLFSYSYCCLVCYQTLPETLNSSYVAYAKLLAHWGAAGEKLEIKRMYSYGLSTKTY